MTTTLQQGLFGVQTDYSQWNAPIEWCAPCEIVVVDSHDEGARLLALEVVKAYLVQFHLPTKGCAFEIVFSDDEIMLYLIKCSWIEMPNRGDLQVLGFAGDPEEVLCDCPIDLVIPSELSLAFA